MKKTILEVLDFINGIIVFFGAVLGIAYALSVFLKTDFHYCLVPSLLCLFRFIYKIGGKHENNET